MTETTKREGKETMSTTLEGDGRNHYKDGGGGD